MLNKVKPYSFYYGVAIAMLAIGFIAELFAIPAAVVLSMFALLSALYGIELQKEVHRQSNARKITLWITACFISALVFLPLLRP